MKRHPNLVNAYHIIPNSKYGAEANVDGKWVPARPLGTSISGSRLKLAWMVFTGRADVLVWPGQ